MVQRHDGRTCAITRRDEKLPLVEWRRAVKSGVWVFVFAAGRAIVCGPALLEALAPDNAGGAAQNPGNGVLRERQGAVFKTFDGDLEGGATAAVAAAHDAVNDAINRTAAEPARVSRPSVLSFSL